MTKKIWVYKYGAEIEFAYKNGEYLDYLRDTNNYGTTSQVMNRHVIHRTDKQIKCLITKEYYPKQVELLLPFDTQKEIMQSFKTFWDNYKNNKAWRECVYIEEEGPQYVGTHIHIWFKNIKEIIPNIKFKVLNMVMTHILRAIKHDIKRYKSLSPTRQRELKMTMSRVIRNHNIWIYTDKRYFWYQIKDNAKNICNLQYIYTNWVDTKKYQPMLWSLKKEVDGKQVKPLTLEIRIIPNYIMVYHPHILENILSSIEPLVNKKNEKVAVYKNNIIRTHKNICLLYKKVFKKKKKQTLQLIQTRREYDTRGLEDFIPVVPNISRERVNLNDIPPLVQCILELLKNTLVFDSNQIIVYWDVAYKYLTWWWLLKIVRDFAYSINPAEAVKTYTTWYIPCIDSHITLTNSITRQYYVWIKSYIFTKLHRLACHPTTKSQFMELLKNDIETTILLGNHMQKEVLLRALVSLEADSQYETSIPEPETQTQQAF